MSREKVGIIGAMEVEVELLKRTMADAVTTTVAGMPCTSGTLGGMEAVVVRSGIGKVNAALCAQALIDRFGVTQLVNTGVAGSLDAAVDIGDIVVATDCVQHDFDAGEGYGPGVIPEQGTSCFAADPKLRRAAAAAVHAVAPNLAVHGGRIATGDQFVNNAVAKTRITSTFGARCCEMEGAAIAQVAHANAVPFVVIRAISDKADDSAETDYPAFVDAAARRSAAIVERMLGELM